MKMSVNQLITYFATNFANPTFTVQTAVPTSGSTTAVTSTTTNTWLLLSPAGTLATATITLPAAASAVDGTVIIVNSAQEITALTVTSSGASVSGKPAGLLSGNSLTLRYNTAALTWYVVASNLTSVPLEVQTTAPSATGFTVTITASTASIWAKVNGTGNFATGTINLPAAASSFDGQEVLITTQLNINTITFASSGATFLGNPTGLGTSGMVRFRYETSLLRWTMIDCAREQPIRSTIGVLVSELPSAVTNKGARSFVTDSTVVATGNFAANVAGTGVNTVPVFSDGTSWKIG
jgi:hypothetical protein